MRRRSHTVDSGDNQRNGPNDKLCLSRKSRWCVLAHWTMPCGNHRWNRVVLRRSRLLRWSTSAVQRRQVQVPEPELENWGFERGMPYDRLIDAQSFTSLTARQTAHAKRARSEHYPSPGRTCWYLPPCELRRVDYSLNPGRRRLSASYVAVEYVDELCASNDACPSIEIE